MSQKLTRSAPKLLISFALLSLPVSALSQGVGSIGGGFSGGNRFGGGIGGGTGISAPRSGIGIRSNPIANPSPSLTPHEVLNPRGSLSSGQVLNPQPSLRRPRSGGSMSEVTKTHRSGSSQNGARSGGRDGTRPLAPSPGSSVRSSASALDHRLSELKPDQHWQEYLGLERLKRISNSSDPTATRREQQELKAILRKYQDVSDREDLDVISKLPEFQTVANGLRDHLAESRNRMRSELVLSFSRLGQDLRRFDNGEPWAVYLGLPSSLSSQPAGVESAESAEQLQKLLVRFEKLMGDPTYDKVTSRPKFQSAYTALTAFVDE